MNGPEEFGDDIVDWTDHDLVPEPVRRVALPSSDHTQSATAVADTSLLPEELANAVSTFATLPCGTRLATIARLVEQLDLLDKQDPKTSSHNSTAVRTQVLQAIKDTSYQFIATLRPDLEHEIRTKWGFNETPDMCKHFREGVSKAIANSSGQYKKVEDRTSIEWTPEEIEGMKAERIGKKSVIGVGFLHNSAAEELDRMTQGAHGSTGSG